MTTSVAHIDSKEHRAWRRLFWLAVANVACAAIFTVIMSLWASLDPLGLGWARSAFGTLTAGMITAQSLACAIVAGLIPGRRFTGLFSSLAFSLALGTIGWVPFVVLHPTSAVEALPNIWAHCFSISVFAIAQGLRILFGWRLALPSNSNQGQRAQFGIADLIEWTLSIGVFLGLGQTSGWFSNPAQLALFFAWQTLATLPLALSVVSRGRSRWVLVFFAIGVTIVGTAIYEYVNAHVAGISLSYFSNVRTWLIMVILGTSYVIAIAVNLVVVRRLGFRLTTPVKQAVDVV